MGMPTTAAKTATTKFFENELENTRNAIADGDLPAGFPCDLGTAIDSLQQAPEDIQMGWFGINENSPDAGFDLAAEILSIAILIRTHGPDTPLSDLV